jgi:hypothetical protein
MQVFENFVKKKSDIFPTPTGAPLFDPKNPGMAALDGRPLSPLTP